MNITKRINELREQKGWSINNLAMEAGLTQSTLSSILIRDASPRVETIESICKALGITLSQFFNEEETFEIITKEEKELIKSFRNLSKEKQKNLINLLK